MSDKALVKMAPAKSRRGRWRTRGPEPLATVSRARPAASRARA
jgi:hypothetical protein